MKRGRLGYSVMFRWHDGVFVIFSLKKQADIFDFARKTRRAGQLEDNKNT